MCKGRLNPWLMQFLGREQHPRTLGKGGFPDRSISGRVAGAVTMATSCCETVWRPRPGRPRPLAGLFHNLHAFPERSPRVIAFRVVVQKLITTTNEICVYLQRKGVFLILDEPAGRRLSKNDAGREISMPRQDPHLSSSGIRTGRIRAQIASSQDGGRRKELRKRGRLEEKACRGIACRGWTNLDPSKN